MFSRALKVPGKNTKRLCDDCLYFQAEIGNSQKEWRMIFDSRIFSRAGRGGRLSLAFLERALSPKQNRSITVPAVKINLLRASALQAFRDM